LLENSDLAHVGALNPVRSELLGDWTRLNVRGLAGNSSCAVWWPCTM